MSIPPPVAAKSVSSPEYTRDELRLEAVTVCVGFDDFLDETLAVNHPHFDTMIVVTSHDDYATQRCAYKHGAICVLTDLFYKNGRQFNKGAAINAGFDHFQYRGWRVHLDSDIALPDNFRRILFNHTHLDRHFIYGADRVDVYGKDSLKKLRGYPQQHHFVVDSHNQPLCHRYVNTLEGYLPIGFFQLWNAFSHKNYPYSLGTAGHDDTMFSASWPRSCRALLPGIICHHLVGAPPKIGENWDGNRKQPRIDKPAQ